MWNKNKIFISIFLLSTLLNTTVKAEDKLDFYKDKKKETNKEIIRKNSSIENKIKEKEEIFKKIEEKRKNIEELGDATVKVEELIERLSKQIKETKEEIEKTIKEIERDEEALKKRIRVMYSQNKSITPLEVLLSSNNIGDFLSKFFLMQSVTEYNQKILDSLKKNKILLNEENKKLEEQVEEKKKNKKEYNRKRQQLMEEVGKEETLLKEVENNIKFTELELKELKDKLTDINANISFEEKVRAETLLRIAERKRNEEEKKKKKLEEAVKEKDEKRKRKSTPPTVNKNDKISNNEGMKFGWPLDGHYYISSYFGWRPSPMGNGTGTKHTGIDIPAPYGTPVYSISDGIVEFSGWNESGYGNLVIIRYDDNTRIYYGHNSSLIVSSGDKVKRGQVIAQIGSTGYSTGNHCHLEIRINNIPTDPIPFVR